MSLHKLSAGDGYIYLTRQVAAGDSTERGRTSLADYYAEKGETPGRWVGAGLAGLGMTPGEVVGEDQMVFLFGEGRHPDTGKPLGRPFPVYDSSSSSPLAAPDSVWGRVSGPWRSTLARQISEGTARGIGALPTVEVYLLPSKRASGSV